MKNLISKYRKMWKFRDLLKYQKMVKDEIGVLISRKTDNLRVYQPIYHLLDAGGKLVRPTMVLLSCEAVGGDPKTIVSGAAGAELGHVASLIHDDVIDGAQLRRGVVSVQEKFGVHDAVLSGDLLVFHSFLGLAHVADKNIPSERVVRALGVMAQAGIDLCIGQELESKFAAKLDMSEEEYIEVITRKTGALTRSITECGAILGGGNEEQIKALAAYGENLGIAFQIKDDLLSVTKTDEEIMKSTGTDVKQKIITLPVIYAMRMGNADEKKTIERIFSSTITTEDDFQTFIKVLRGAHAIEEAEKSAWKYVKKAKEALSIIPQSKSKEMLLGLTDFVVERPF